MEATFKQTKAAWIRNAGVPQGQPALGRFNCPCGDTVTDVEYGGPDRTGDSCGTVFDGYGWIHGQH